MPDPRSLHSAPGRWSAAIGPRASQGASDALRLSEVISALSYALDLTEGQVMGHASRTCVIGMRLADRIGLPADQRLALFYALLLKDAGCSSNAARMSSLFGADDLILKRDVKLVDHTSRVAGGRYTIRHVDGGGSPLGWLARVAAIGVHSEAISRELTGVRCERGAEIVRMIGMPPATAEAIRHLDEHWDGHGHPAGLRGPAISVPGRILCLAQTFEVFLRERGLEAAFDVARQRRGTWFDPGLVRALEGLRGDRTF